MRIIIATIRKWHIENALKFKKDHPEYNVKLIHSPDEFTREIIDSFNPDFIMCPHWSWIIPEEIFTKYKCIVYHVSDVPNARGGSPVQNQIWDGLSKTMISAILIDEGLDTGPVYLKRELSLMGGAEEIFIRSSRIIFEDMMPYIIENNPNPEPQNGMGYCYKRRSPDESRLIEKGDLLRLFDQIRMLDADGYPRAFLEWGNFNLEFSRPKLSVGELVCDVKITYKENDK